jgi:hypothetical protein
MIIRLRQRDISTVIAIISIVLLFYSLSTTFWQKLDTILSTYSRDLFSLLFFYPFFSCLNYLFLSKGSSNSSQEHYEVDFRSHTLIKLMLVVTLATFITAYRFMVQPTPQGADTPHYLYVTNLLYHNFDVRMIMGDGRELTYLFFLVIRVVLENLFNQTFLISLMAFPVVLSALSTVSVYRLIQISLKDSDLALLASLFSGASMFMVRISYDLFSNQFALSLSFFALAEYYSLVCSVKVSSSRFFFTSALFALVLFASRFTWFFLLTIVLIHVALTKISGASLPKKQMLLSISPSALMLIVIEVATPIWGKNVPVQWYERFATPTTYSALRFPFEVGEAAPLTLPSDWNWIAGMESPFILILAAIGMITLLKFPLASRHLLVVSWLLTPGILLIATGYVQSYRLVILYPIGILSAYGVLAVFRGKLGDRICNIVKTHAHLGQVLRAALIIFVVILVLNSVLPRAFISNYVYYPGNVAVNQLLSIRRTFGFSNNSVVVIVHPRTLEPLNSFQYARAIVGSHVYIGELADFLEGKPFLISNVKVQLPFSSIRTIAIPTALYPIGRFEENLSQELSSGVRIIFLNSSRS